jgi:preprotein translocase subunit SecG
MLDIITIVLTVIEVLVALLLIGIVLIQQSKSGGGLGAVSGGVSETVFGPTAGNVLAKATVVLASCFLGITLILAIITGHRRPGRSVIESLPDKQVSTPAAAPPAAAAVPQQQQEQEATPPATQSASSAGGTQAASAVVKPGAEPGAAERADAAKQDAGTQHATTPSSSGGSPAGDKGAAKP